MVGVVCFDNVVCVNGCGIGGWECRLRGGVGFVNDSYGGVDEFMVMSESIGCGEVKEI